MNVATSWLGRLHAWCKARKPKRMDELIAVEFDEREVRIIGLAPDQAEWNQQFFWTDITRVCFKDEGLYSSDYLRIDHRAAQSPVIVLTEARGGGAFFGALTERGFFPEQVSRRAMGETGGALHCWPPLDA